MSELQKLILVGNGKIVGKYKRGHIIDRFDKVARFNSFVTKGFEKFCGSKTNFLCRRSINNVEMFPRENFEAVFNFITYCNSTSLMKREATRIADFYKNKYVEVNDKICKEISDEIGLNAPKQEWASVGVLAIGYFLRCCPLYEIYITGFDYAEGTHLTEKPAHYFPRPPSGANFHNWRLERAWIRKLVEDKKIFLLPLDPAAAECIITGVKQTPFDWQI